jgi:hypothetical protein
VIAANWAMRHLAGADPLALADPAAVPPVFRPVLDSGWTVEPGGAHVLKVLHHGRRPAARLLRDMTQEAVLPSYREDDGPDALWRRVIAFLDRRFGQSQAADTVIGTSFLYSLPWPEQPGYGIVEELGPTLRRVFAEVRPGGE